MEPLLKCPECGGNKFVEEGRLELKKCAYCGAMVQIPSAEKEKRVIEEPEKETVVQVNIQQKVPLQSRMYVSSKSKTTAGLLAIFLGGLGIYKFYLGRNGEGVLILLLCIFFCWTFFIPLLIGLFTLIEGIVLLGMSDSEFYDKYG